MANRPHLNYVQPALCPLVLADVGLINPQPLSEVSLCDVGITPRGADAFDQDLVRTIVYCFWSIIGHACQG